MIDFIKSIYKWQENSDQRLTSEIIDKIFQALYSISRFTELEQLIIKKDNKTKQEKEKNIKGEKNSRIKFSYNKDIYEIINELYNKIIIKEMQIGNTKDVDIAFPDPTLNIGEGFKRSIADKIYLIDKIKDSFLHLNDDTNEPLFKVNGKNIYITNSRTNYELICTIPIEALKEFISNLESILISNGILQSKEQDEFIKISFEDIEEYLNLFDTSIAEINNQLTKPIIENIYKMYIDKQSISFKLFLSIFLKSKERINIDLLTLLSAFEITFEKGEKNVMYLDLYRKINTNKTENSTNWTKEELEQLTKLISDKESKNWTEENLRRLAYLVGDKQENINKKNMDWTYEHIAKTLTSEKILQEGLEYKLFLLLIKIYTLTQKRNNGEQLDKDEKITPTFNELIKTCNIYFNETFEKIRNSRSHNNFKEDEDLITLIDRNKNTIKSPASKDAMPNFQLVGCKKDIEDFLKNIITSYEPKEITINDYKPIFRLIYEMAKNIIILNNSNNDISLAEFIIENFDDILEQMRLYIEKNNSHTKKITQNTDEEEPLKKVS